MTFLRVTFSDIIKFKKGHSLKDPAAAAKSLQSCPTLCGPIRRQPTRLPRPWDSPDKRTRTLEWIAISFSNA